jgi:hypothetical protein
LELIKEQSNRKGNKMSQINTQLHNELIYGAISAINFCPLEIKKPKARPKLIQLITLLALDGYNISNVSDLFTLGKSDVSRLSTQIEEIISSTTKEAFYLRKSFGKSHYLEKYTQDDWAAIMCQYYLTYNKG